MLSIKHLQKETEDSICERQRLIKEVIYNYHIPKN